MKTVLPYSSTRSRNLHSNISSQLYLWLNSVFFVHLALCWMFCSYSTLMNFYFFANHLQTFLSIETNNWHIRSKCSQIDSSSPKNTQCISHNIDSTFGSQGVRVKMAVQKQKLSVPRWCALYNIVAVTGHRTCSNAALTCVVFNCTTSTKSFIWHLPLPWGWLSLDTAYSLGIRNRLYSLHYTTQTSPSF